MRKKLKKQTHPSKSKYLKRAVKSNVKSRVSNVKARSQPITRSIYKRLRDNLDAEPEQCSPRKILKCAIGKIKAHNDLKAQEISSSSDSVLSNENLSIIPKNPESPDILLYSRSESNSKVDEIDSIHQTDKELFNNGLLMENLSAKQNGGANTDTSVSISKDTSLEKCLVFLPSWQDNTYTAPVKRYTKSKSDNVQFHGTICRLMTKQKYGYINPENHSKASYESIKFDFDDLVNLSKTPIKIGCGSFVAFTLSNSGSRRNSYARASRVFVDMKSKLTEGDYPKKKFSSQNYKEWFRGVVVKDMEKNYFIKALDELPAGYSMSKDIFLPKSNIRNNGFPLVVGDEIEVKLGTKDPNKPFGLNCRVIRYFQRSLKCIFDFFDSVMNEFSFKLICDLLYNAKIWLYFSSIIFKNRESNHSFLLRLMEVLSFLYRKSQFSISLCQPVFKQIMTSSAFDCNSDLFKFITFDSLSETFIQNIPREDDNVTTVFDVLSVYFKIALQIDKSYANRIMPFVFLIGQVELSQRVQNWLIDVMRLSSSDSSIEFCRRNWREIDFIPKITEIQKGLLKDDSTLLPVKVREAYYSCDEYMETYYRLLRVECYSAIQTGIKQYSDSSLDYRDMNVYVNVAIHGHDINKSRLLVALRFTPVRQVKRWESARNFMFGNLLCISPGGNFKSDHIWAIVAERNINLLNESSAICVQLCTDHNQHSDSEVLILLSKCVETAVMVESPSYFNSLKPVLESLQRFDMENFSFKDEIVEVGSGGPPDYLSDSTMVNLNSLYKKKFKINDLSPETLKETESISKEDFLLKLKQSQSTFDQSQIDALNYSLTHRLAIIQGPPGCGKTFIGVELVKIILSCSPEISGPILILTYKNHALDEFLKHTLEFLATDDIVRIGNRSKELFLNEHCSIKNLSLKLNFASRDDIKDVTNELFANEKSLSESLNQLYLGDQVTCGRLLQMMSEDQIESLILNANFLIEIPETKSVISKRWLVSKLHDLYRKGYKIRIFCSKTFKCDSWEYKFIRGIFTILKLWSPLDFVKHLNIFSDLKSRSTVATQRPRNEDDYDLWDEEYIASINDARMYEDSERNSSFKSILELNNDSDFLFTINHLLSEFEINESIINISDPWRLSPQERLSFILSSIALNHKNSVPKIDNLLKESKLLMSQKEKLERESKVEALKKRKIIGMTITGASLNQLLLQEVAPPVVIVEEAAEVLEPNLLAALSPALQHLILIGDHKQLRPQVDTYRLKTNYKFDTSMMERLIKSDYPFKTLQKQNRMLPEFSALLKDIYPKLEDNLSTVGSNKPTLCLEKSMFFWTHNHKEEGERSYKNEEEVSRIEWLVLFLIKSGCLASDITVLASYLGQTMRLKNVIRSHSEATDVIINTIDMYQGDENKYVIISLVRSNDEGKIGFLSELNRRCVAQSRAKCGMYFVGNDKVFLKNQHWRVLIEGMSDKGCVGDHISIQCVKHQELSRYRVQNSTELQKFVKNPSLTCSEECGESMRCDFESHICKRPCLLNEQHDHYPCKYQIQFKFAICGHPSERQCWEEESGLKCKTAVNATLPCGHSIEKECHRDASRTICKEMVKYTFDNCEHILQMECYKPKPDQCKVKVKIGLPCGHTAMKECYKDSASLICIEKVKFTYSSCGHKNIKQCYQNNDEIICMAPCLHSMSCSIHKCKIKCGLPHNHEMCRELVDYTFPCGHTTRNAKMCYESNPDLCLMKISKTLPCKHRISMACSTDISSVICQNVVKFFYSTCKHPGQKMCHENENEVPCTSRCSMKMDCKIHRCPEKCGLLHSHDGCTQMVDFTFPCGHTEKLVKMCSSPCEAKCNRIVNYKGKCRHEFHKTCSDTEPKCIYPCLRKRKCGHFCGKECGDDCEIGQCKFCLNRWEERLKVAKEKARKKIKVFESKIANGEPNFAKLEKLSAGEMKKVEDFVIKFIKFEHDWFPTIVKIEKIFNLKLNVAFEQAKLEMLVEFSDYKFHGTSIDGIEGIIHDGFKIPEKDGMFGRGIYFATDSSKSAQSIYTKGSNQLLLCNVLLGNTLTVSTADNTLTLQKIREQGCDSVFAPRGTKSTGGVVNDEYVIYDCRQAYPEYLITFKTIQKLQFLSLNTLPKDENFRKTTVKHSRTLNSDDDNQKMYRYACGQFYQMISNQGLNTPQYKIDSIDIIQNRQLEENFNNKKNKFLQAGISDKMILAFHGTKIENIDNILKDNFQLSYAKRQAHGVGNYFSEYPQISLGYGNGLILCWLIPGREYQGEGNYPVGYHSKLVKPDPSKENSAEMVIIRDSDQILPHCVIHLSR